VARNPRVEFVGSTTGKDNNISIVLKDVEFSDAGKYTCHVKNPKEKDAQHNATIFLTVVQKSKCWSWVPCPASSAGAVGMQTRAGPTLAHGCPGSLEAVGMPEGQGLAAHPSVPWASGRQRGCCFSRGPCSWELPAPLLRPLSTFFSCSGGDRQHCDAHHCGRCGGAHRSARPLHARQEGCPVHHQEDPGWEVSAGAGPGTLWWVLPWGRAAPGWGGGERGREGPGAVSWPCALPQEGVSRQLVRE